MNDSNQARRILDTWDREGLTQAVFDALAAAHGARAPLTVDDLAPLDQFHGGGKEMTARLAARAGVGPGMRVLDLGGGLGGPARMLAALHGCRVTVLDLAPSYVEAGAAMTERLGLSDRVAHRLGHALEPAVEPGSFDVVWTQNSGMNIADKAALVAAIHRALRPGGIYALQEPMAGPVQPPHFPLMWAPDASTHFVWPPEAMRDLIERAGFRLRAWDDVTADASGGRAPAGGQSIQSLVMGERLAAIAANGRRNRDEGRLVMVQAVFERIDERG